MAEPLDNIAKALQTLTDKRLLIGVPREESGRAEGARITNASLGYIHERGSEAAKVPARPHLVPGVKKAREEIVEGFKKAAMAALRGDTQSIDVHLKTAGEAGQREVQGIIQHNGLKQIEPESLLSRVTSKSLRRQYHEQLRDVYPGRMSPIERAQRARREGRTLIAMARNLVAGVQPLYDTGDYETSIRYAIRDKSST